MPGNTSPASGISASDEVLKLLTQMNKMLSRIEEHLQERGVWDTVASECVGKNVILTVGATIIEGRLLKIDRTHLCIEGYALKGGAVPLSAGPKKILINKVLIDSMDFQPSEETLGR
jgi:hypothetical protein